MGLHMSSANCEITCVPFTIIVVVNTCKEINKNKYLRTKKVIYKATNHSIHVIRNMLRHS